MIFGQLVIGPPGSGKTTYCKAMHEFLQELGRKVAIVNLDPANDVLPYQPNIDISNLVSVEEVMDLEHLGPNGGLIRSMEFLEEKIQWLIDELSKISDSYLLFDCPGQVELYTHHASVQNIVQTLYKSGYHLSAIHLVDSHYCSDPGSFVSVLLTSLSTMLQLEMPQINVLSKCDLIEKHGPLHFNLDYYTDVLDLSELLHFLSDDPIFSRYKKLNKGLTELIENYSLVSFYALSINIKKSLDRVLLAADKANGYVFGVNEENRNIQNMLSSAMEAEFEDAKLSNIQETCVKLNTEIIDLVSSSSEEEFEEI